MSYEVISRIGRGGMGVVDLARDEHGDEFALKRLSLHGTPDELSRARQRIRREADVLRRLDHPAIVRLRDVIDDGDDIVLVMDYLAGGNLAQHVQEHGPLTPDQVRALAVRLLDALAYAHRHGVTHRDIKPANVLFDARGQASLADFGVAVHRDATPGLTATDVVVGTPGFLSPEQARGDLATPASDVFALGATLAFAATGSGPFGTADPRVLLLRAAAGRTEKLPWELPADLRQLLTTLLEGDPTRRPTAAAAAGGPAGTSPGLTPVDSPRPRHRRTGVLAGVSALIVCVLVVGGALGPRLVAEGNQATAKAVAPTTTTVACRNLPYQRCGQPAAPHTDGRVCTAGFADYNGSATDGCEAAPDTLAPGTDLAGALSANLVPGDDVDEYPVPVADNFQLLGDGTVEVTLTAPAGVSMRLTVLRGSKVLGTTVSGDRSPATVRLREASYFGDDSGTLTARVSWLGSDRSGASYHLERSGDF